MDKGEAILRRSLLLDLETTPDGKILKVGAVAGDQTLYLKGGFQIPKLVQGLDALADQSDYVLGHNILDHDLAVLREAFPSLHLHALPVIDTLFLSPIAFPENPYHRLVKDYRLLHTALNDPVCDARNAGVLFQDQWAVFVSLKKTDADLLAFYAWAFRGMMGPFFDALEVERLRDEQAIHFFAERAAFTGCRVAADALAGEVNVASAYVLAWLHVAGANSIMPPWVRHRFRDVTSIVRQLRDICCDDPDCAYCRVAHDPEGQLRRYFGFDAFREKPELPAGGSLQEAIVRCGMNGQPLLAILPTGGGKSLCFQLPALVRNMRRGVLTVVVSPLQALMKDQVDNLNRVTSSTFAAALYGMLTPPERGDVLERVRLGDVALLYVSPEQLRNGSFRNVIREREVGCWVFDEAHCLSRWGHSFRPDYLYASRFIRELAASQGVDSPPVACFTATAKRDVVAEIQQHFERELSQKLTLFDGGAERTNLDFEVQLVHASEKRERVKDLLMRHLPVVESGSAVVYCATRKSTEEMARWLQRAGLSAEAFHAGLCAPEKRRIQEGFVAGEIQHICATNAFGMGIDKDNVRLVVHADIPGSLENYLQEAGRAGRDRQMARCILLYDQQDVETQFSLSAMSRLTRRDIAQILRGLRRAKRDNQDNVVITAGEILRDELVETDISLQDSMAVTKVNTAVSMLERGRFVERNQNRTHVLQVRPLMRSMEEAQEKIDARQDLSERTKRQWLDILEYIFNSDPGGISVDHLAELPSMGRVCEKSEAYLPLQHDTLPIIKLLNDMVNAHIIEKDTLLSAYVKVRCVNAAEKILNDVCALEKTMLKVMQEQEPDAEGWMVLSVRHLNQRLMDEGCVSSTEAIRNLLKSLSLDGQGLASKRGSIDLKYRDQEHYRVKLQRSWDALIETAMKRQTIAHLLLDAMSAKIPASSSGEHLVKFSESDLLTALQGDMYVAAQLHDFNAAMERGLLFLHEQKAVILQQGLAIFRQAMTITILPGAKGRQFTHGDFSSLKEHYRERTFQIHVMNKYADLGLGKIKNALALVAGYFTMKKTDFVKTFFAGEEKLLERATSAESYQTIVDQLNNGVQTAVVAAPPHTNMLVLAGPGSGKTRVIAHRCAYLLRVERVRPKEVLVVCFNRVAATSLRQRIRQLVGRDANGVTIQTYHALAMRLIGASFSAQMDGNGDDPDLDKLIPDATRMLRGECDIPGLERDDVRERLLTGYRYILIDEYQDIDQPQYDLISAIAGRTLDSDQSDAKLSILAVGDDDQNVYAFRGANVQFIRQFEEDYSAKIHYLVENYRSTARIIDASNQLIALNRDRMKTDHPVIINASRRLDAPGAPVDVVGCTDLLHQARVVLRVVIAGRKKGDRIAVFSRTKEALHMIRAALECKAVPVYTASDKKRVPLYRMRETHALMTILKTQLDKGWTAHQLQAAFSRHPCYDNQNPWCTLLDTILCEWKDETSDNPRTAGECMEYIYEALQEYQRTLCSDGAVYLSTVHAAKGLEFDHVILLGNWQSSSDRMNQEEERRLFYVGMTRARTALTLFQLDTCRHPYTSHLQETHRVRARPLSEPPDESLHIRYGLLDLADIWISYPARAHDYDPIRRSLASLHPGSPVFLKQAGERLFIVDARHLKIGALSAAASAKWIPHLPDLRVVKIHAIITWKKEWESMAFPGGPDEWEVPLLYIEMSSIPVSKSSSRVG